MRRLTALDATFVNLDTPSSHLHVAAACAYDVAACPGWGLADVRGVVDNRLHLLPPFRWRLIETPFGLGPPRWIEDPGFDIDRHLSTMRLTGSGGPEEFMAAAATFVGRPLDRRYPLWEICVVEGLQGGYVGVILKSHHAAVDGVSGVELTTRLLDLTADTVIHPAPHPPWAPDTLPDEAELLREALIDLVALPGRVVRTVVEAAQRNDGLGAAAPPNASMSGLFEGPRTVWNAPISPSRRVVFADVALDELKGVRAALGGTVNDVVLAVCAGGLRRYLHQRDEPTVEPLVALVPVSVRSDAQAGAMGNRIAQRLCTLATDVGDPLDRYRLICAAGARAKEQAAKPRPDALTEWLDLLPPAVVAPAARLYRSSRLAEHHRPAFNLTISNVAGPQLPLFMAGARLVAWYPMGPIYDGVGLNITVLSYDGRVYFGLVGCAQLISDIGTIAGHLKDSLSELSKLSVGGSARAK